RGGIPHRVRGRQARHRHPLHPRRPLLRRRHPGRLGPPRLRSAGTGRGGGETGHGHPTDVLDLLGPARRLPRPGEPGRPTPDARYRGPENQLYRVEVHAGGEAKDATFKWSRENGSVVFPVDELDGTWVQLASLGYDDKLDLDVGDHVEFTDTAYASRQEALP